MRAEMVVLLRERRVLAGSIMRWVLLRRRELGCRSDQLASAGELLGARVTAIGEQAVVPDAVEALGQHVHEEPANELARLQRHGCVAVRAFEAVVLYLNVTPRRRRSSGCWRWRRDGCNGKGRPAPALARRRDAWHRRTSPSSTAGRGSP